MANETDIGQATGGLGLAIGGAIVQFNKTAVFPSTLNMVSCPKGTNKARIPVYDKLGTGNVETASTGVEGVVNREVIASNPKDIEVLRNHIDALLLICLFMEMQMLFLLMQVRLWAMQLQHNLMKKLQLLLMTLQQ